MHVGISEANVILAAMVVDSNVECKIPENDSHFSIWLSKPTASGRTVRIMTWKDYHLVLSLFWKERREGEKQKTR